MFYNTNTDNQLIKRLSATPTLSAQNDTYLPPAPVDTQAALQANKAKFFFQLVWPTPFFMISNGRTTADIPKERELEKVNAFYLQKEAEVSCFRQRLPPGNGN